MRRVIGGNASALTWTILNGLEVAIAEEGATSQSLGYPANSAVEEDSDRDGLTDPRELAIGTDPTVLDSDGDGRDDGVEILRDGTDPLDATDVISVKAVGPEGVASDQAAMDVDSDGNLHIVWVDFRDGAGGEIYYAKLDSSGSKLVDDVRLTNDPAASRHPDIAVDSKGQITVVWDDARDGGESISTPF